MNVHLSPNDPDLDDATTALSVLRTWAEQASPTEIARLDPAIARLLPGETVANYPPLSRDYPQDFVADAAYRATLPDLQNGPANLIRGPNAIYSMWAFQISACRSAFIPAMGAI